MLPGFDLGMGGELRSRTHCGGGGVLESMTIWAPKDSK